jgi:FAD:protein FMN transferase
MSPRESAAFWLYIMSRSRKTELRRLRPFLGTFVEIRTCGLKEQDAVAAIDRAFAEIATIEERMSAHDPKSDLGRFFNAAPNEIVSVHPWTFEVIGYALKLHRLSEGAFDITVGSILERNRYLPQWQSTPRMKACGTMADIELLQRNQIRLRRPARLDLGGIAKGFAVDRAAEALIEAGAGAGCVNAGGDFRIFGDCAESLLLRDPMTPNRLLRVGEIHMGAVATSSGYFRRRRTNSGPVTPLVDGRTRKTLDLHESITVIASSCMWADALTKVLAIDLQTGTALLKHFDATAVLISGAEGDLDFRVLPSRPEIQAATQWNESYDRDNDSRE